MPDVLAATMSEDALLSNVLDLCRTLGLHTAHFRPAWTDKGWRTPVAGDGKGFPDLVIVGAHGVLYRELKRQGGRPSAEQKVWLERLTEAGADASTWLPVDWRAGAILEELKGIR